jgi:hypothetical protein
MPTLHHEDRSIAVVLDLMNSLSAFGRSLSQGRELGCNKSEL